MTSELPENRALNLEVEAVATLRGSVGVVVHQVLFYASAGLAFAGTTEFVSDPLLRDLYFEDDVGIGWTGSLGVETPIATALAFRLEYLYVGFSDRGGEIDLHLFRAGFQVDPREFSKLGHVPLRPYLGAGTALVHHTGYDGRVKAAAEEWTFGAKVFAGLRFSTWGAAELTYYHLGTVEFLQTEVRSDSATIALLILSEPLLNWNRRPRYLPSVRLFGRVGGGCKFITEDSAIETQSESGFVFHVGGGADFEVSPRAFVRLEYEFLSRPGTDRIPNLMHTPVSLSVGLHF